MNLSSWAMRTNGSTESSRHDSSSVASSPINNLVIIYNWNFSSQMWREASLQYGVNMYGMRNGSGNDRFAPQLNNRRLLLIISTSFISIQTYGSSVFWLKKAGCFISFSREAVSEIMLAGHGRRVCLIIISSVICSSEIREIVSSPGLSIQ